MEERELFELSEKAHHRVERTIGLTMAIIAAFLAMVTLMGHRLHTEEVVSQTKAADGWAFYQAKNARYHLYATDAQLAQLIGEKGAHLAEAWTKKAEEERHDAEEIRKENEHRDQETNTIARRAAFFDAAEICLEVAIVLCSVSLLTGMLTFWKASFVGAAAGLVVAGLGLLR
jgi:Domain of unknown function (DUF4337)